MKKRSFARALAAGAVLALAACSGGSHSVVPVSPAQHGAPATSTVRVTVTYPRSAAASAKRRPSFVDPQTASLSLSVSSSGTTIVPPQTFAPTCSVGVCSATTSVTLIAGTYTFTVKAFDASTPAKILSSASVSATIANGPQSLQLELGGFAATAATSGSVSGHAAGADLGTGSSILSGTTIVGAPGTPVTVTVGFTFADSNGVPITGKAPFSPDFEASNGPVRVTALEADPFGDVMLGVPAGSTATCAASTCTLNAPSDTLTVTLPATVDPGTGVAAFPHDVVLQTQFVNAGVPGGSPQTVDAFEVRTACAASAPACVHFRPQGQTTVPLTTASLAVGPSNVWLGAPVLGGFVVRFGVLDLAAETAASETAWTAPAALAGLGAAVPGLMVYEHLPGAGDVVWSPDITKGTAGAGGAGALDAYDPTFSVVTPPSVAYTTGALPAYVATPNGGEGSVTVDVYGNVWFVDPSSYRLIAYDPYTANPAPPAGLPADPLTPGTTYACALSAGTTPIAASLVASDPARARVWFTAWDGTFAYAGFATASDIVTNAACNSAPRTKLLGSSGAPRGLAVDAAGNAWYDDVARVGELTTSGAPGTIAVQPETALPGTYRAAFGIAYNRVDGKLYVSDAHGLLGRFDPSGGASAPASTVSLALPASFASTILAAYTAAPASGLVGFLTGAPQIDPAGRVWILAANATGAGPLNVNLSVPTDRAAVLSIDPSQLGARFTPTATAPASLLRHAANAVPTPRR